MADKSKLNAEESSNNVDMSSSESDPTAGNRMATLRDVMQKTVNSFTKNLRLIKPLRNLSSSDNSVLKQLEQETRSQLNNNIMCELEQMYSDENVEVLLNNLDKMIADNTSSTDSPAWRPSGNPRLDSRCHVAALKREKLKVLEGKLAELEAHNKLIQGKVEKRATKLIKATRHVQAITEDFEQIIDEESRQIQPH